MKFTIFYSINHYSLSSKNIISDIKLMHDIFLFRFFSWTAMRLALRNKAGITRERQFQGRPREFLD